MVVYSYTTSRVEAEAMYRVGHESSPVTGKRTNMCNTDSRAPAGSGGSISSEVAAVSAQLAPRPRQARRPSSGSRRRASPPRTPSPSARSRSARASSREAVVCRPCASPAWCRLGGWSVRGRAGTTPSSNPPEPRGATPRTAEPCAPSSPGYDARTLLDFALGTCERSIHQTQDASRCRTGALTAFLGAAAVFRGVF